MSNQQRILRLTAVQDITGLTRSTLYKLIKDGQFPKQISLGARAVGWLAADVQAWLDERIAISRYCTTGAKTTSGGRQHGGAHAAIQHTATHSSHC